MRRCAIDRNNERTISTHSRQKKTSRASAVATCSTTMNARYGDSPLDSSPTTCAQLPPIQCGTSTEWPRLEIGNISVTPCKAPNTMAWTNVRWWGTATVCLATVRQPSEVGPRAARLRRLHPCRQLPTHLLELCPGGHLLGEQRGLDAVEEALEPAHELRLRDPQFGIARDGVLGERQRDPFELFAQLRREAGRELLDRAAVDLAEPGAAGVVEWSRADLFEQLLDHRADPHHLRRLLDHVGKRAGLLGGVGLGVRGLRLADDWRSVGADSDDAESLGSSGPGWRGLGHDV